VIGDPTHLTIVQQPSTSAQSGIAFLQQPIVEVRDAANNLLAGFAVTATIVPPGGGALLGTTTVTTNGAGVAAFTNLRVEGVVGERALRFTSEGASIVSGSILLTAGAPASLVIDTQPPPTGISGEVLSLQPAVEVRDPWTNPVPFVDVEVDLQGGGSVGGNTTATTNGSGVATFSGLSIDDGPGARTLRFSSGDADATSTSVHVSYSVGFHPDRESFCAGQLMDVSVPSAAFPRPAPVVGFIHGGGWTSGDQKAGLLLAEVRNEMLSRGYVVVSMTYRKAAELVNRWPVQIHDVKCVIRHMRSLADDYGADGDRSGVWGASAGGHLASMLGVTDADDAGGSLEGGDVPGWSSRVQAAVAIGGISDVRPDDGAQSELDFFGPEWTFDTWPGPSQELGDASPVTWATGDDPPFLVIHGTADTTVEYDQAVRLDTALGNAGADVTLLPVTNGGHNLNDVGVGTPSHSLAEVAQIIADFFDDHVK
jgi:acetyl esterase/lipase